MKVNLVVGTMALWIHSLQSEVGLNKERGRQGATSHVWPSDGIW